MGLLPAGEREAELVLYISAHSAFDTCPSTQAHVSVPSLGGSSDAVRSGDREGHVGENTGGGSDPTTVLCSTSEVQERIEDRRVGDRVGGVVPGERGAHTIPDGTTSLEVRPKIEAHGITSYAVQKKTCVTCSHVPK